MKRITGLSVLLGIAAAVAITVASGAGGNGQIPILEGRLIAVGIPGVSAVAPVGTFLPGGPIPAKFAAYTQPGQVLDPKRILVGSTSNFGEPVWSKKNPSNVQHHVRSRNYWAATL